MKKNQKDLIFCLIILGIALGLRLYKLDQIPGEMWGDVIEHFKLTQSIQKKDLFFNFRFGGDGPMFSYLSAFVALFSGPSFYSLKLTSTLVGSLFCVSVYFLCQEYLKNKIISFISGFIAATSFWSISFSRQAKPHILVPLFITLTLLFYLKNKKWLTGIILGFGMYTQAGFWGMPFFFVNKIKILAFSLPLVCPLLLNFYSKININGRGGFFTEKLALGTKLKPFEIVHRIITNYQKNFFSFFTNGDSAFRHTIPNQPHIDRFSSIFFALGLLLFIYKKIKKKKYKKVATTIILFCVIQIPSVLDITNPHSIPNMGRMIGVLPIITILVAYGIYWTTELIKNKSLKMILITLILLLITTINSYKYFYVYPQKLPNQNTPFGKIIAQEINKYPLDISAISVGAHWGDYGQPEPNSIRFQLKPEREIFFFEADINTNLKFECANAKNIYNSREIIFITDPKDTSKQEAIKKCIQIKNKYLISKNGHSVAWLALGKFI